MSRRARWRLVSYGPGVAVIVVSVALGVVRGWALWPVFALVGVVLIATSGLQVSAYRAGYWRGRSECVDELLSGRLLSPEELGEPSPWDDITRPESSRGQR